MHKLFSIPLSYEKAVPQALEALNQRGMKTKMSFDLNVARSEHPDCECPYHGTEKCDCQMVVILIYGDQFSPATLVAHGRDGRTQFHIDDSIHQRPDPELEMNISIAIAKVGKMNINR